MRNFIASNSIERRQHRSTSSLNHRMIVKSRSPIFYSATHLFCEGIEMCQQAKKRMRDVLIWNEAKGCATATTVLDKNIFHHVFRSTADGSNMCCWHHATCDVNFSNVSVSRNFSESLKKTSCSLLHPSVLKIVPQQGASRGKPCPTKSTTFFWAQKMNRDKLTKYCRKKNF